MDSICSALAYARLKEAHRLEGRGRGARGEPQRAHPVRAGAVRRRAAGAPGRRDPAGARRDDAGGGFRARPTNPSPRRCAASSGRDLRGLPVVDEGEPLPGFAERHQDRPPALPAAARTGHAPAIVRAALADIVQTFEGMIAVGPVRRHRAGLRADGRGDEDWRLSCSACASTRPQRVVLIVGDREDIQQRAIDEGVRALIVTGGMPLTREIQQLGETKGVTLVRTRHDTATTVLLARGAVRVGQMIEREFASFEPEVSAGRGARTKPPRRPRSSSRCWTPSGGWWASLTKSDFLKTVPRQLILVDHNELSQAVHGADKLPIIEIIDHHRLGGFASDTPIHFWNNPGGFDLHDRHDAVPAARRADSARDGRVAHGRVDLRHAEPNVADRDGDRPRDPGGSGEDRRGGGRGAGGGDFRGGFAVADAGAARGGDLRRQGIHRGGGAFQRRRRSRRWASGRSTRSRRN